MAFLSHVAPPHRARTPARRRSQHAAAPSTAAVAARRVPMRAPCRGADRAPTQGRHLLHRAAHWRAHASERALPVRGQPPARAGRGATQPGGTARSRPPRPRATPAAPLPASPHPPTAPPPLPRNAHILRAPPPHPRPRQTPTRAHPPPSPRLSSPFQGFDIAKKALLEFLDKFKEAVDPSDREQLRCVARTSLRTKLYAALADQLTDIVADAVLAVRQEDEPIDLHMVRAGCGGGEGAVPLGASGARGG